MQSAKARDELVEKRLVELQASFLLTAMSRRALALPQALCDRLAAADDPLEVEHEPMNLRQTKARFFRFATLDWQSKRICADHIRTRSLADVGRANPRLFSGPAGRRSIATPSAQAVRQKTLDRNSTDLRQSYLPGAE